MTDTVLEWRYLPGGAVRHAMQPPEHYGSSLTSACRIGPWHIYDWRGTGSPDEAEIVDSLPDCQRCTAVLDAARVPAPPRPRLVRLDVAKLYAAVERERLAREVSNQEFLWQLGEHGTAALGRLRKLHAGAQPSADLLVRLLAWLGTTDVGPFVAPVDEVRA